MSYVCCASLTFSVVSLGSELMNINVVVIVFHMKYAFLYFVSLQGSYRYLGM
jgi:hypothetical protein